MRKFRTEEQNTAAVSTSEDMVICLGDDECYNVLDPYVEWVIDSKSSCHVTPRKELFTSYKAGDFGRVKMGNIVCLRKELFTSRCTFVN